MAGGPWTGLLVGVLTLPLRTTVWLWTRPEVHADAAEPHGDVAARRAMHGAVSPAGLRRETVQPWTARPCWRVSGG